MTHEQKKKYLGDKFGLNSDFHNWLDKYKFDKLLYERCVLFLKAKNVLQEVSSNYEYIADFKLVTPQGYVFYTSSHKTSSAIHSIISLTYEYITLSRNL